MVVGLAGAVITVAALPFSSVRMTTGRTLLALGLLLLHGAACAAYYLYVQHSPADSNVYYLDKYHLASAKFALGTVFTGKLTQVLRNSFGGSFLECFIFFQAIGFWGVMVLMRTFQEIHLKLGTPETILPWYLLFLPSIHFWTSAIGKDAPLFFAVSLCTWCVIEFRSRLALFALGIFVMILFRAHVALIVLMSLAVAAALHPGVSFGRKVGLIGLSLMGAYLLIGSVTSTIHVDVTDANSIATFLQDRNDIAAKIGGGSTIGDAPLPLRFVALLFRPFFFDAPNIPGMIASVENIGSVLLFGYLIKNWRGVRSIARQAYFVEYCLIFSVMLISLLTVISHNIGLGLRERVMVFPAILSLFVAHWAMPRRRPQPLPSGNEFLRYGQDSRPLTEASR